MLQYNYFQSILCLIVSPPMHAIWLNWSMNTHVNVQEEEEVKQEQELEHEPNVKKRKLDRKY